MAKLKENPLVRSLEAVMRASRSAEGMTMRELAKATGHRQEWLRPRLMILLEENKLDVGRAQRRALDGTMRPIPVYRLKS